MFPQFIICPFLKKLKYLFVSLKAFNKGVEKLKTSEDEWLYCLKNAGSSDGELPAMQNGVISESFKRLLVSNASSQLLQEQIRSMEEEELREIVAASSYLKGLAEGEARGKAEGKTEGIAIGEARGAAKEKAETARLMFEAGEPIAKIMKFTNLSEAQIKTL